MPYVHRGARLCFLAHPRTASQSVADALEEQAGFVSEGTHHAPRSHVEVRWPEAKEWTFFCVVRNPYDALVSWWAKGGRPGPRLGKPSPDWIALLDTGESLYHKPGSLWWLHGEDADVVTRYERLEVGVNEVLIAAGLGPVTLPWRHRSARVGTYRDYYDDVTRAFVADRYGDELLRWGYSF